MAKCLITGINSFTGTYVKSEFEKNGFEVFGTVFNPLNNFSKKTTYQMDLFNKKQVEDVIKEVRPDLIIHLAGISYIRGQDPEIYYATHVNGTLTLLSSVNKIMKDSTKIILASSGQVYGDNNKIISENNRVIPNSDYAVSKLAMEYMAKLWRKKIPIIIARPFNYTGRGQNQKFVIPKIVDVFRRGDQILPIGNIDVFRDFSDVRYIAKAYFTLAKKGAIGEIYNLSSGNAVSISQIIEHLEKISGQRKELDVRDDLVRENEQKTIKGCNKKFNDLGSIPSVIPIRDTIKWMLEEEIE